MKTIRISQDVWDAMAKVGKFGETPDDVLRRVFSIDQHQPEAQPPRPLQRYSERRMSAKVENNELIVGFENGKSDNWGLPDKSDKASIKLIRDLAVAFATDNGASIGQINAVKKALTEAGYHLIK